ncbi:hypothetical protein [Leeuwenhoekiella sp. NPDC079379]|uniref:hypothetical protein n=1 Tax=Leeuwenhoekiella sp. NPDC079379 TaxID=3364122 RepID=UPI0037C5727F
MKFFWPLFAALLIMRPVVPVFDYIFNYDYIADELCVNRDKPELNCNGRCYLMQALADEASKKKNAEERGAKNNLSLNITYFINHNLNWEFDFVIIESKNIAKDTYILYDSSNFKGKLIKPPITF